VNERLRADISLFTKDLSVWGCAHKKGEVVGPAGGETGVPRCLAEVRMLLKAALFHYFWIQATDANSYKKACQIKK